MSGQDWYATWTHMTAELVERRAEGEANEVSVEPGLVVAEVHGRSKEPRRVRIGVRRLADADWGRLRAEVEAHPTLAAALMADEVPLALLGLGDGGSILVPSANDLAPECSCGAWDDRCGHVRAVLDALGDRIELDPAVLLTLRDGHPGLLGVDTDALAEIDNAELGVAATAAWARVPGPLPEISQNQRAAMPLALGSAPPAEAGLEVGELHALVLDASRRAEQLLGSIALSPATRAGLVGSGLDLDTELDLVRRSAEPGAAVSPDAMQRCGLNPEDVQRRVVAWRIAGAQAVSVEADRWTPSAEQTEPGLSALGGPEVARCRANRVTRLDLSLQVRLDQDGLWWPFASDEELGWVMSGLPAAHPGDLTLSDLDTNPPPASN